MRYIIYILIISLALSLEAKAQRYKYTNQTEAGIMIGLYGGLPFSLQTFNGIKLQKPKVDIGLTTGIDSYAQMVLIPIALGIRYPSANKLTTKVYAGLDAGYSFDWLEYDTTTAQYEGGWMINPAVGLKFRSIKASRITLSVGYKHQLASIHSTSQVLFDDSSIITSSSKYQFNRVTFRIGINH